MAGNGSRLTMCTGRTLGGRYAFNESHDQHVGAWRNWTSPEGPATLTTAARPTGYVDGAYDLPRVGGEMSFRGEASGTITASMLSGRLMVVELTGMGDLSAAGALIVAMVAAIGGTATLTTDIAGRIGMVCDLSGAGDLDATATGTAALVASIGGTASLDALITAFGDMSVDIVVTGAGITTVSIADAVWAKVLEAGFDAASVLRLIAAATAGEASGAPDGPMVFTGLDGTTPRIEGDIDGQGNRTNVTYDGGA